MSNIKWVFYTNYWRLMWFPLVILILVFLVLIGLTYFFVWKELKKNKNMKENLINEK